MTDKQSRIQALIGSIVAFLNKKKHSDFGAAVTLAKLEQIDSLNHQFINVPAVSTPHGKTLGKAIAGVTDPEMKVIADCILAAKDDLVWREDRGQFYEPGTNLGAGYTNCNLHTLLVGPDGCSFHLEDFLLGIFVLGPKTLYRDHKHKARELYLNLSDRSGWRFEGAEWTDYQGGSVIWNDSNKPHATRVYEKPFISVFAWTENISSKCTLVFRDDWEEIEHFLQTQNQ